MKICAFLWTYYGYPNSNYEGVNVEVMRYRNGEIMARDDMAARRLRARRRLRGRRARLRRTPRHRLRQRKRHALRAPLHQVHAHLAALASCLRNQADPQPCRQDEADSRCPSSSRTRSCSFVDDSIVRGTQLRETVDFLYESGADEVHMRSACPPIMYSCKYLSFSAQQLRDGPAGATHHPEARGRRRPAAPRGVRRRHHRARPVHAALASARRWASTRSRLPVARRHASRPSASTASKVCTYCWNGKE